MIKSIFDVNFAGKKVLVRVDFNVPLDENFIITDDSRIKLSLPTIDKIIKDGGIPILVSHLGRPKGQINPKYSLRPVANYLQNQLGYKVNFCNKCSGNDALELIKITNVGELVLLDNIRFYKEEETNEPSFSKKLSSLADAYVNDAFGTAHRAHASTEGVTHYFGNEKYAGSLMLKELQYLGNALDNPAKPFVSIIGGSKISGKIDVIKNLLNKCDTILIGGGMTFTFLKAMGLNIGNSLLEQDKIELANDLLKLADQMKVDLILPQDIIIAKEFRNDSETQVVKYNQIPDGWIGMDIGPETNSKFNEIISKSKTVFWNGPMGVFEMENFATGTLSVAESLKSATTLGATTIVGGGDSAAAIHQLGFTDYVSHVSTGGGASLEFLEGKELPGIKALEV